MGLFDLAVRIPAFAYPLLAILVVGVLSYYAFFRPGNPPLIRGGEPPVLRDGGPADLPPTQHPAPEIRQGDAPQRESIEGKPDAGEKPVPQSPSPIPAPAPVQRAANESATHRQTLQSIPETEKLLNPRADEGQNRVQDAAARRSVALPPTEGGGKEENGEREVNAADAIDSAPQNLSEPAVTLPQQFSPRMKSAFRSSLQAEVDSTAMRDSLKADSLKKMQQFRPRRPAGMKRKP